MNLINLSIDILWLALGVLILGAIVWVALWAVKQVLPIPDPVEKVIWAVFLILVLIAILSLIAGGSGIRPFHWFGHSFYLPGPADRATATAGLQGLLNG